MAFIALGGLLFMLAFLSFLLSASFLLQAALSGTNAVMALMLSVAIALILLISISWIRKDRAFFAPKKNLYFYRALLTVLFLMTYIKSLEMISLTESMFLMQAVAVFVLAFAWLFTGEVITWAIVSAVIVGLFGSVVLYLPFARGLEINIGFLLALVSAALLAFTLILSRQLSTQSFLRPFLFYQILYTALLLAPIFPFYAEIPSLFSLGLSALSSGFALLGYLLLYFSYQFADSSELSPFIYSQAIFYPILGGYVLSGQTTWYFVFGAFVILLGMLLVIYKQRAKQTAR